MSVAEPLRAALFPPESVAGSIARGAAVSTTIGKSATLGANWGAAVLIEDKGIANGAVVMVGVAMVASGVPSGKLTDGCDAMRVGVLTCGA